MKLLIQVHPNAKIPRVATHPENSLDIYVSQSPIEGKANAAVIKALAKHLGVSKSKVRIVSGIKGKKKVFEVLE